MIVSGSFLEGSRDYHRVAKRSALGKLAECRCIIGLCIFWWFATATLMCTRVFMSDCFTTMSVLAGQTKHACLVHCLHMLLQAFKSIFECITQFRMAMIEHYTVLDHCPPCLLNSVKLAKTNLKWCLVDTCRSLLLCST